MQNLGPQHVLVRGMNARDANFLYDTFVVSRWMYAVFIQPFTATTSPALDAVDAAYISTVLTACRATGPTRNRATLRALRALLRIPSPALRRTIVAHGYARRVYRMAKDSALSAIARTRARATPAALPQVPGIQALVPDLTNPWQTHETRQAGEVEWRRTTQHSWD